jgi:ubiquitin carboxyl-terminal hydrolase 36/42
MRPPALDLPPDPPHPHPLTHPQKVIFPYDAFLKLASAARRRAAAPRGLLNVGNSCYANATMQCLLATRPLRAFLDAGVHATGCRKPGGAWCLLCELQELCRQMAGEGGDVLSIRPLLRNIRMVRMPA